MTNIVTNELFAEEQIKMSQMTPEFPDLHYYQDVIETHAGDRIKLLIAAADLLEIARRSDPSYGLRMI